MWSDSYHSELRPVYDRQVRRCIRALRPLLSERTYPSMDPGASTSVLYRSEIPLPPRDSHPKFALKTDVLCDSLLFEHAASLQLARLPWLELDEIGFYEIQYDDGSTERVPLTYGGNICHWARRYGEPFRHMYYRHTGYCGVWYADGVDERLPDGQPATFYRYEWANPHPDKPIAQIVLHTRCEFPTGVLVRKIESVSLTH